MDIGQDLACRSHLDALRRSQGSADGTGDVDSTHPDLTIDITAVTDDQIAVRDDRAGKSAVDPEGVFEMQLARHMAACIEKAVEIALGSGAFEHHSFLCISRS